MFLRALVEGPGVAESRRAFFFSFAEVPEVPEICLCLQNGSCGLTGWLFFVKCKWAAASPAAYFVRRARCVSWASFLPPLRYEGAWLARVLFVVDYFARVRVLHTVNTPCGVYHICLLTSTTRRATREKTYIHIIWMEQKLSFSFGKQPINKSSGVRLW